MSRAVLLILALLLPMPLAAQAAVGVPASFQALVRTRELVVVVSASGDTTALPHDFRARLAVSLSKRLTESGLEVSAATAGTRPVSTHLAVTTLNMHFVVDDADAPERAMGTELMLYENVSVADEGGSAELAAVTFQLGPDVRLFAESEMPLGATTVAAELLTSFVALRQLALDAAR